MATSPAERMLCLAMTVLGPLTSDLPSWDAKHISASCMSSTDTSLRSLLGRSVFSIFSSVEWNVLKTMTSMFGTPERCLQKLEATFPIPAEDKPYLCAGATALRTWERETDLMNEDLAKLRNELEMTQAKCRELATENACLRQKCEVCSEAGIILEQDRQQLQSLLSDKCKLLEENQHLEREISSLQELLDYATEHAVKDNEMFNGGVTIACNDDDSSSEEGYAASTSGSSLILE